METAATYAVLGAVTRPLVESGYYVFPVAVVDKMMRQNGRPTPVEMHLVSLAKLRQIFNPDAVLYLTVTDWGTSYQIVNASTRVRLEGKLVDAATGAVLWRGEEVAVQNSSREASGLADLLAGALVDQVASTLFDPSPEMAKSMTWDLLTGRENGWLLGPYHPDASEDAQEIEALYQELESAQISSGAKPQR